MSWFTRRTEKGPVPISPASDAASPDDARDLLDAARHGDAETVRRLIESGLDSDVRDDRGQAPIILAIRNGHGAVVQLLLDHGANPHSIDFEGEGTALAAAVRLADEAIARQLIAAGADLNPALIAAIEAGNAAMVELLLDEGAFVDGSGGAETPLTAAAGCGNLAMVQLLLAAGAEDWLPRLSDSKTPHEVALDHGHDGIAKLLESATRGPTAP
jgi:ankyrin repeat protein